MKEYNEEPDRCYDAFKKGLWTIFAIVIAIFIAALYIIWL